MAKYNANMPSESYDVADLEALRHSNLPNALATTAHFDSADDASVFFARELDYIKSRSYDKLYPEFTALKFFPITHEVPEGAETTTYYSYDKTGFAKIIANYATDLPRADVKGVPTTAYIKSVGDSYGYSMQEMRASRLAGKSLDVRKADAARYQIERLMNNIAWAGDTANNLMGVLTVGNSIPLYTLANASAEGHTSDTEWKYKTAQEILNDINGMVAYMASTTKNVEKADSLALPPSVYIDIATRHIPNTNMTVLKFLLENAPYLKNIHEAPELEADSTETNPYSASSKAVAFLYTNDPDKFSIEIPMDYYQYPLQPKGLEIEVPCEARVAGAILYYPMSALIATGV